MLKNNAIKAFTATIIDVIVALLIVVVIGLAIKIALGSQIDMATSLIDTISIDINKEVSEKKVEMETLQSGKQKMKVYPSYGQRYGDIKIQKIGIELPIFYGDSLEILKNGVGHSTGSYMPGEGGSIIYGAHNSADKFRKLSNVKKGDSIVVATDYGTFTYKVNDMKVVLETELDKLPIQEDKEILMLYTCYPFDALGYTTQRYVVYANLDNWQAKE